MGGSKRIKAQIANALLFVFGGIIINAIELYLYGFFIFGWIFFIYMIVRIYKTSQKYKKQQ